MKKGGSKTQKGVALIISVMLLSLVLFLVIFFLSFSVTENKISRSQLSSNNTYYLVESAINDVIYKLNNDQSWLSSFISSSTWVGSLSRSNVFGEARSGYSATIKNTSLAHATIYATSSVVGFDGKTAQRVIKVNVYRAIGNSAMGNNALLSDGPLSISNSEIVLNGNIHSNSSITVSNNSDITINGTLEAVGVFTNVNSNSSVHVASTSKAANLVAGPASVYSLPAVDFNSTATTSMKSRSARIYTAAQFMKLASGAGSDLELPGGITYVIGNVTFNNNIDLKLQNGGAIVIEGSASFTLDELEIKNPVAGQPTGIIVSGNLDMKKVKKIDDTFYGVMYAGGTLTFGNLGSNNDGDEFVINGGVAARNIIFSSPVKELTINYLPSIVNSTLPSSSFSPVISTDHWEEQY